MSMLFLTLGLVACGSDSTATTRAGSGQSDGPTKVAVTAYGVSAAAPLAVAKEQGFFEDEDLNATITYAEAAAQVPSVVSGDAQFAFLNAPAVLVARSNGVPVVAVAGLGGPPETDDGAYIQILVPNDSDIREPRDLNGKTVAVDTLFQLPDLSLRKAFEETGVDTSSVKFVEMPFPQMADALKAGQVDAINATEPFITIAEKAGARRLMSAFLGQDADWPQAVMISSEKYVGEQPDVVAKFQRVMEAATEYSQANPEAVRALVPTFTQVPPPLAQQIRLPVFSSAFSPEGWQGWTDVLEGQDLLDGDVDPADAFVTSE